MNEQERRFLKSNHTIIVSDIHLADAEPPHPENPLWKRYKRPKHFIDKVFSEFMDRMLEDIPSGSELVLNGDIFDFDSVMAIPKNTLFPVSWLEKKRGLFAEELKSTFKIKVIMEDHPVWVSAIRRFLEAGNRVIFVIGNHDMELHWPGVQAEILKQLALPEAFKKSVIFSDWFYVSNKDTLIEHGNQYDAYTLCSNPIHPFIKKRSKVFVRLPFGNLANRFLTNGMGLLNPHLDVNFIKSSFLDYLVYFFRDVVRTQPLLGWSWLWGSMVTLINSIQEGFLPAIKDPLAVENRVNRIAKNANSTPRVVRSLRELHVHPVYFNPFQILRELWLDRALFFVLIVFGSFQLFSFLKVFANVSIGWFLFPVVGLLPVFYFYARSVTSEVLKMERNVMKHVPLSAQIAHVQRVVHGHTHKPRHLRLEGVEFLNSGTWSPAYLDVECTKPVGRKCFVWIRPVEGQEGREAGLYEWLDSQCQKIAPNFSS
jgi:UDP-2,3-diacylglucosamine pyrophosphatase LpxH